LPQHSRREYQCEYQTPVHNTRSGDDRRKLTKGQTATGRQYEDNILCPMETKCYKAMHEDADLLLLLKELCRQAFNFKPQNDQAQALQEAFRRFVTLSQDNYSSNKLYLDRFTNSRDVIKHIGGELPIYPVDVCLKKKNLYRSLATLVQIIVADAESVNQHLTVTFILGAD